jgi:hypothetical protein
MYKQLHVHPALEAWCAAEVLHLVDTGADMIKAQAAAAS